MPPMTPPSRHSQMPGASDVSHAGRSPLGVPMRSGATAGEQSPEQARSVADFFAEALDGAMALVRADGGEIATLDDTRQVLVSRARRTTPLLETSSPALGIPAHHSQPLAPKPTLAGGSPSASYGGGPFAPGLTALKDETSPLDEIEVQSTQLLPATLSRRTYRKGERLIGYTWEQGDVVVLPGDKCRELPGGTAPSDAEAAWHLAVPIFQPGSLATSRSSTNIIGVIAVYNKEELWSFSTRDIQVLSLHADRTARAMHAAELVRQNQSQADLLNLLGVDAGDSGQHAIYQHLRDLVRQMIDAPSFAVLLYHARQDEVSFELAERDGLAVSVGRFPATALPPWWGPVRTRHTICISAPEDRALRPEYCVLGWGDDHPVQSILAAPLMVRNECIGAVVAGSPRPDVYAPEHARLFATIGQSAAVVIQNALLNEERRVSHRKTRAKEHQLSVLNNAVMTLNASLDLDETLRALVGQAAHLTQAHVCSVLLLNESGDWLIGQAANAAVEGAQTPLHQTRLSPDWRGLHDALRGGQFLLLDHLDLEWEDDTDSGRFLAEQRVQSCLVMPIVHKETPLGILMAYSPGQRYHFPSEEIVLLQGLASQAAVAISNARLYQRLERAYEQQKELDRLKDEFILTVSHEFRTPVTAIDGYVTLISKHGHKLDHEKLDQFASEIRQATNQLMGMVNMLHDANSLSNQPVQMVIQPVNVRAAAERAIQALAPEAKARMVLEVAPDHWVMADSDRLTDVFSNLLSNAIKYSPAGKPCQITARLETREALMRQNRSHAVADGAPEQWVVVGVRDWGEGITSEDQARLFRKFVRLARSLTTSVRGTGLGLWICRQFLDAMGGDIWVESEFGTGSHFQFSLAWTSAPGDPLS